MDDKQLTQESHAISNNIRQKYWALKHDLRESDELSTWTYKPILEPLTQTSEKLKVSDDKITKKVEEEDTKTAVDMTPTPTTTTITT